MSHIRKSFHIVMIERDKWVHKRKGRVLL